MGKIIVEKSQALKGVVTASGSKNAALPIMAACILTDEECIIEDVPRLKDVRVMCELLECLGAQVNFSKNVVKIKAADLHSCKAHYGLVNQMRGSFLLLGPLLAKMKKASISMPGGCRIGARPIDLHLKGFAEMGAVIEKEHGDIEATGENLVGSKIYLDFPSVGATENIMMAASLTDGQTIIENAAAEPEITDLADFINKMGGRIAGAGTDCITIDGVDKLHGTTHKIIPDRIEIGTFMVAAAITGGQVLIENVVVDHISPAIAKLKEMNVTVEERENSVWVSRADALVGASIKTLPFPGFPTDLQSIFSPLMAIAPGHSTITESVFENRFLHVGELNRMGANIKIEGRTAIIEGVPSLSGVKVVATDLRAGAALILAGLCARGTTEIDEISHIERGYADIIKKIQKLGGNIEKK